MSEKKSDKKPGSKGPAKRRAIRKRPIKRDDPNEVFQQEPEAGLEVGDGGRPGKRRGQA